jgi:hypothetical protein
VVSSLLDVRVEIATVRAGAHQAAIDEAGNVEIVIYGAVEKLHFHDPSFGVVPDRC